MAETMFKEKITFAKMQAGLVWLAAAGKMDKVGTGSDSAETIADKLKGTGIFEEK